MTLKIDAKFEEKCTEELCVIIMKNDKQFEDELICRFKIDMGNLTNFDSSTWKDEFWPKHLKVSKNVTLMISFWAKYILPELKKYSQVIFHDTEEWYKIWRGIDLSFQNWHEEFDKFWPEHSKVSKMFNLLGYFWAKYILLGLKKYRGSIFHDTEERCKIWRKTDLYFGKWREELFILMGSLWPKYIILS